MTPIFTGVGSANQTAFKPFSASPIAVSPAFARVFVALFTTSSPSDVS